MYKKHILAQNSNGKSYLPKHPFNNVINKLYCYETNLRNLNPPPSHSKIRVKKIGCYEKMGQVPCFIIVHRPEYCIAF